MAVEWLGKGFALDILAVFPLYGHFDCIFSCILYRQVNKCPSANRNLFVDGLLKPPVVIDCFVIVELVQHERNSNHSWSLHRRD